MTSQPAAEYDRTTDTSSGMNGPVVAVEWLAEHLDDPDLVVFCASMGDPEPARAMGIPGALLADIDADFSDSAATLPHTVPGDLVRLLESYGISDDTTVIVYDRHGLMVAPRVWWLLKIAGLSQIAVLDGGLPAWIAQGLDTEALIEPAGGGSITSEPNLSLLVGADSVQHSLARSNKAVVDARSAGRFSGVDPEPRPGLHRGHIPGSVNLPFTELVDARGLLRPAAELRDRLEQGTEGATSLVFSCGSGVTACVAALAATVAGYDDVVVYDGSWADWGHPEHQHPIA